MIISLLLHADLLPHSEMCDDSEQAVHHYTRGIYEYFTDRTLCLSDRALGSAQSDGVTFNATI
jgi:hypothetical protein